MGTSGISGIGGFSSLNGTSAAKFDPAKMLEAMIRRFIKKTDGDGDGSLSSQELSGLSADAFKALDANEDGKLSADEIKSALQKALDQMKQALSSSDPRQALDALKDTPEGQLMQLMRPGKHHRHQQDEQSQSSSSISIQITQINVSQTIYNISGTPSSTSSSSNINVVA